MACRLGGTLCGIPRVIDPVPPGQESQPRSARRVTLTDRWEPAGESSSVAAEGDEDPFALRLPTLLVANKVECLADADAELRAFLEVTGLRYPALTVSAATGQGLGKIGPWLFSHLASPASTPRRRAAARPGTAVHTPTAARPWRTSRGFVHKDLARRSGTRASGVQPDSTDSRWA